MRAIWWRELRELGVVAVIAAVFGAVIGVDIASDLFEDEHLIRLGLLGAGVGLLQGLLDRVRRADGFLLHRPVPTMRIHLARTLAAGTVLAGAIGAMVAAGAWWTWREHVAADRIGRTAYGLFGEAGPLASGYPLRFGALDFDETGVLLGLGFLLGGYALARFAASRRSVRAALVTAGACGIAAWSLVARFETGRGMAIASGACAVLFLTWLHLDLAGDRR